MIHYFDPAVGIIRAGVRLVGPAGDTRAHFAVDTGATRTGLRSSVLLRLGYPLSDDLARETIALATRVESVPVLRVTLLQSLGVELVGLRVHSLLLPQTMEVDGLLGLDFFRGTRLLLDFKKGRLRLT